MRVGEGDGLEYAMKNSEVRLLEWEEPHMYDLNVAADRRQMYSRIAMGGAKVVPKVAAIAEDLFELEHPDKKQDTKARQVFVDSVIKEGDRFGKWHYFPWSNKLVQFADAEEHRLLLTFRNRELLSSEELRTLGQVTLAHVGLSVGSHIVENTSHIAMGKKVILADPDVLSVPNLNRINAGMPEVGMYKTDIVGIALSELNPYVKQIHLKDGITQQNVHIFEHHPPRLVFEEVDHLPTKILMRKVARQAGAALIMATDTGDRTMVDIERYDNPGETVKPFLGALSADELIQVERVAPTASENVEIIRRLIGMENISVRLMQSMGQIGLTLGGIAQLGTTAAVGGAYAAVAGREIILGRGPKTGRYKVSPQEILKIRYI